MKDKETVQGTRYEVRGQTINRLQHNAYREEVTTSGIYAPSRSPSSTLGTSNFRHSRHLCPLAGCFTLSSFSLRPVPCALYLFLFSYAFTLDPSAPWNLDPLSVIYVDKPSQELPEVYPACYLTDSESAQNCPTPLGSYNNRHRSIPLSRYRI